MLALVREDRGARAKMRLWACHGEQITRELWSSALYPSVDPDQRRPQRIGVRDH